MAGRSKLSCIVLSSEILIILALISVYISPRNLIPSTLAQQTSPNITINITITSFADIALLQSNYSLPASVPGSSSAAVNFTIRNTGSTNITNIHAFANTFIIEDENPLDSGSSTLYASTGLVFIKNESGGPVAHLGRLEWNLTQNLEEENLDLSPSTRFWGRGWYRNGSNTYLWKVENGTTLGNLTINASGLFGVCNTTGTIFTIKNDPENDSSGLVRSFASGGVSTGASLTQSRDWGIFSMNAGPLNGYCVATFHNCTRIYIYKYDKRTADDTNFNACTNSQYLRAATLFPGEDLLFQLVTSVPEGVPAGEAALSTLTIAAT